MQSLSLSLIMPVYNEEKSLAQFLPNVVAFCQQKNFQLIIVNDGSTDQSYQLIDDYKNESFVKIIHSKMNGGYGAAIKKGIRAAETDYVVTLDADGQHSLTDIEKLFQKARLTDADMIVGDRGKSSGYYRSVGKWILHRIAGLLMPLHIKDINSGMKLYHTGLAKKYISICPNTMAFSDIIMLAFVYNRNRVIEEPITIQPRISGKSTINTMTAVDTLKEIINIVVLFNPMRIFFPLGLFSIFISLIWAIPIFIKGNGLSVGALLGVMIGIVSLFFGLLAEQISAFRKATLE